MKKKYVLNKGIATGDIIIAITIVIMFVSVITTMFYSYYISITARNRANTAINIMIDIIENVKLASYNGLNDASLDDLITRFKNKGQIQSGYNVEANVQKYNEIAGNETKQDIIKILTVNVSYLVGDKNENLEIRTLIIK